MSVGRLKSARCWSNGHAGGGIDVTWRIDNGAIYSEEKRYLPLPPLLPLPQLGKPDPFEPTPDAWTHNGSGVKLDRKIGLITYTIPKASLKDVVKPVSIIFEGGVGTNGFVIGTAYAFKKGCPPASYPVRGAYSDHNERLTLTGPWPKRAGCQFIVYTYNSSHSKLVINYAVGD